ncbi:MAG: response regulator [Steroidobacteraceae bacterium]
MLVVDDDSRTRELMHIVLSAQGYAVASAADGPSALAAIRVQIPDVMLADFRLPGMDGAALCRHARELAPRARMAIVVLSGSDDPQVRQAAVAAGADEFLTKPCDRMALRDCLARLRQARWNGMVT